MEFIDTHTHLYLDEFSEDREGVLLNAQNAGVQKFLLPNIDSKSLPALLELCAKHPNSCYPMIGLHPTSVNKEYEKELQIVENQLKKGDFIAIGEVGIDLYWDKSFKKEQYTAFRTQIQWSLDYHLPLIIHSRDAHREIMDIVGDYKNTGLKGIFHCFTGSEEEALEIIDHGFLLGIGGVLSFKNSKLKESIANIPLEHIVLETDSPFLAPAPYRGKRNESAYIAIIAEHLARIKQQNIEEVAYRTTQNAINLFHITL